MDPFTEYLVQDRMRQLQELSRRSRHVAPSRVALRRRVRRRGGGRSTPSD